MLLITGANGQLGRLIVEEVLRRKPEIALAVSVRDVAAASDLAARGVEVRQGDYDDPALMRATFVGVDRLLLMPTPTPNPDARVAQMLPVVRAAADAGVKHVVYPGAAEIDGLYFPLFTSHERVFAAIEHTGVAATTCVTRSTPRSLRARSPARPRPGSSPRRSTAHAWPRSCAPTWPRPPQLCFSTKAATRARPTTSPGPMPVGWNDLAALASQHAGKPIPFRPIDDAETEARLTAAGVPAAHIGPMLGFYAAYRAGWSGAPSGDIERLAGRQPTPTLQAIAAVLDGTAK